MPVMIHEVVTARPDQQRFRLAATVRLPRFRIKNPLRHLPLVSIFLGLLMGGPAFAADVTHVANVTRIVALGDGRVVLQFDADNASCSDANSPKGYYVTVGQNGVTADGLKSILSMATVAVALERPLSFHFDSSSAYCFISQVMLVNQ